MRVLFTVRSSELDWLELATLATVLSFAIFQAPPLSSMARQMEGGSLYDDDHVGGAAFFLLFFLSCRSPDGTRFFRLLAGSGPSSSRHSNLPSSCI